ncbi:MAG: hypothetical protein ACHQ9S_13755 [Candidatus Binatia bacterium]
MRVAAASVLALLLGVFTPALASSPPTEIISFQGTTAGLSGAFPPDPNIAVSGTYVVEAANSALAIYNKSGVRMPISPIAPVLLFRTLFAPLGSSCMSPVGDPIIVYDSAADRWLLSASANNIGANTYTLPDHQCLAVSKTNNPLGAWWTYDYTLPAGLMADYEKIVAWPGANAYVLSNKEYTKNGSSPALYPFAGVGLFAFQRDKLLAGDPTATMIYVNYTDPAVLPIGIVNGPDGFMQPATFDGPTPPVGEDIPFAWLTSVSMWGNASDSVRFFTFHIDMGNPGASVFTESQTAVPVPSYTAELNPVPLPACPGSALGSAVDAYGDRLMWRLAYRLHADGHETLVGHHVVDVGGNRSGIRWYIFTRPTSRDPFTLADSGTHAPDTSWRWTGSVATDKFDNLAVGYDVATGHGVDVRVSGHTPTDPPGQLSGETSLIAIDSSYGYAFNGSHRWGDYAAMAVDPSDDCTLWFVDEYIDESTCLAKGNWSTRIGAVQFPECLSLPTPTPSPTGMATSPPWTPTPPYCKTFTPTATPTPTPAQPVITPTCTSLTQICWSYPIKSLWKLWVDGLFRESWTEATPGATPGNWTHPLTNVTPGDQVAMQACALPTATPTVTATSTSTPTPTVPAATPTRTRRPDFLPQSGWKKYSDQGSAPDDDTLIMRDGVGVFDRFGRMLIAPVTQATLGASVAGAVRACSDCVPGTSPCAAGGTGALAYGDGTNWRCP